MKKLALTIVKKEISLNVGQPNNFELLCAMQGDNKSFEITATLYDTNKLYTINTDNIKIKGENPVGLTIQKNVDSHTTNTVTFTLTEDMLMYDGLLKLVLVFTENSTQLTTFPFVIKVINSPGNTTADDIKTVSALVEEAKKWAMQSKSYAVGTDNEVRDGDKTDNSKYYYEQIKDLIDSGLAGSNILYYDTYEEFKTDLDAGKIPDETLICIKESKMYFSVQVVKADNMAWDSISGNEIQNNIEGAMAPVIYTANSGYYFPSNYNVASVNGINVTRNSDNKITISGTPTADTQITLKAPAKQKTAQNPPTGLSDGGLKINGTTSAMEYASSSAASSWINCTDGSTEVAAGTWYVRYKETDSLYASDSVSVVVESIVKNRKLLFYDLGSRAHAYTEDFKNWTYLNEGSNLGVVDRYESYGFIIINLGDMLFAVQQTRNTLLRHTIHDYDKDTDTRIWKNISFGYNNNCYCRPLYLDNNLILIFANGNIYTVSKDEIKAHANDYSMLGFTKTSTGITFGFGERGEIIYGNNIAVIADSNYGSSGKSYYSLDLKTWYDISSTFHSSINNATQKLVYGNKKFLHFDLLCPNAAQIMVLSETSPSSGWKNMQEAGAGKNITAIQTSDGGHEYPRITDVVYNDKTKQFIMPFYNYVVNSMTVSAANGFIIYDTNNDIWSIIRLNLPKELHNCTVIDGNLYGFMNNHNWVCFTDINTGEYTDFGKPDNIYGGNGNFRYLTFETPLWDIDKTEQIEIGTDIDNWSFDFDPTNKTVELIKYKGTDSNVTVYGKYKIEPGNYSGQVVPEEVTCQTKISTCLSGLETTEVDGVSKYSYMFAGNTNVKSITFKEGIDTSETYSMGYMFQKCSNLTKLDIGNLDTTHTYKFISMFAGLPNVNNGLLDLRNFDTSNANDMMAMFYGANIEYVDLSSFDTSKVTDYANMFRDTQNLKEVKVSSSKWTINPSLYSSSITSFTYV